MAGSDQSKNLSGMFQQINAPLSEMGAAGNQYVETFRRSMAPKADMSDSASLLNYADWARRNGYDAEARQYLTLGETQRRKEVEEAKANRLQMGRSSVASLQNEYMRVLKDPTLNATERDAKLADLQASMNAIAGSVEGMDPVRVGQIGQESEAADLARRDREQAMTLRQEANTRAWETFGLNKEAAARAQAQHEEWVATADYRAIKRQIEQDEGRYNAGVRAAKSLVGTEGGKEKFLANPAYADMEGVWNAVARQVEQQNLELENARARANENKYQWTDESLKELGLDDATISKINAAASQHPATANKMVVSFLENIFKTQEPPTAAMLGLFESAALNHVQEKGIPGAWDTESELEAAAGKLALKMADKFMETGGNIDEALKVLAAEDNKDKDEKEETVYEQTARAIAEATAAQQDAADPDR